MFVTINTFNLDVIEINFFLFLSVYIPAPEKVGIVKKDFENLEIHWSPPMDFDKMKHPKYPEVDGYQVMIISQLDISPS